MSQQLITINEISPTSAVANTGIVGLITGTQIANNSIQSNHIGSINAGVISGTLSANQISTVSNTCLLYTSPSPRD